jgi:hypothetical protein
MVRLIVETNYDPPMTDEQHNAFAARLDPCLALRGARWKRTYLSADHRRTVCEFEAQDAESVRSAYHNATVPFDRVWVAEVYELKV